MLTLQEKHPPSTENPGILLALTVALVGIFAFLQVYSIQSILPQLRDDLGASVVQVGNAVGATILAVALVAPVMGMISDAWGRRWIIVASVFLLAVPTALISMVSSAEALTALRFLQGVAVPGITVVMIAWIGEEFHGTVMPRIMAIYVTGNVLGGFLGRFLLGYLTEITHWRTAFLVLAALNLAGGVLVWRVLPASRHFVANPRFKDEIHVLGRLLRNPAVQAASALGFTVLFALVGMFTFINLHLADAPWFFSSSDLANVFAVYLLGVVATPLAGRVMAHFGARPTLLFTVALAAVGVVITCASSVAVIVGGLAVTACAVFITQSATLAYIAQHVSSGRSLAGGLYYMFYYTGGFAGAWLGGIAYSHGGWGATVALLVSVQLVGWVIAWRFVR